MNEITLTDEQLSRLEEKLLDERDSLEPDELKLIELLVKRARTTKANTLTTSPGWLFTWTYRF